MLSVNLFCNNRINSYLYNSNIKPKVIANILFISSWYPNEEDPTLGIFVRRHAEAAALYNNVAVLYVNSDDGVTKPEVKLTEQNGVKELILKYPKVKSKLPGLISFLKLKRYKRYYNLGLDLLESKGFVPDLVHCNIMNPSGLVAKLWKKKQKLPYVVTEHWTGYLPSDGRYANSRILKLTIPKIAKRADKILPVSEDLKMALSNHKLGNKHQVIRNVVDTTAFHINAAEKDRFLVVADLENSQKNINGLIEAFSEFQQNHPTLKLSIAGGGDDETEIKQLVKTLKLDSSVEFHGRIPAEKLNELLSKSYSSILFSNYENLPCVIVEAFSAGVPFISTNVGGIKEIINEERGLLIEPNNKVQLINAMESVLKTDWNSNAIRNYAVDHFSYEKIGQEFNKVYQEVLGK